VIARMIAACPPTALIGLRDRAMVVLQRRPGEVLEALCWPAGPQAV
jgi:hypothetical protein